MLKRRTKSYKIVFVLSLLFIILIESYVFFINFRIVNVSSYDVEIAAANIKINETKKTFSISNDNGSFNRTSREYKEVLAFLSNDIAVIDNDNKLKLININEDVIATFDNFNLDLQYITSTTILEEGNIVKINFIENKNGINSSIDYCYNKDTKTTYVIK